MNLNTLSTKAPKEFDKEQTKEKTKSILESFDDFQNLFFANSTRALLVVIQGMDASGKDGLVKNVFGVFNPMGVQVVSFKKPTEEEMAHDFLWRIHKNIPRKGMIQLFNRSHYEDILIQRVHKWIDADTVKNRINQINAFEEMLVQNNTDIIKLYLHISQEEQHERFKERMETPEKRWKYNPADMEESKLWPKYMDAYEDALIKCDRIPWHIIPADQNWYKEYKVAEILHSYFTSLKMKYPEIKK